MNFTFQSIGNVIIPTDELIFFRGVETSGHRPPEPPSSVGLAGFPGPVSFRLPSV